MFLNLIPSFIACSFHVSFKRSSACQLSIHASFITVFAWRIRYSNIIYFTDDKIFYCADDQRFSVTGTYLSFSLIVVRDSISHVSSTHQLSIAHDPTKSPQLFSVFCVLAPDVGWFVTRVFVDDGINSKDSQ